MAVQIVSTMMLGFLHGFVVWNFIFRSTGRIVRIISPKYGDNLKVADSISHIVVFFFLLVTAFILLQALGLLISAEVSREPKGYLFIGSFIGWIFSGVLPRIEAILRRKKVD